MARWNIILQLGVPADADINLIPSFLLQRSAARCYQGDSFPVYNMLCKVDKWSLWYWYFLRYPILKFWAISDRYRISDRAIPTNEHSTFVIILFYTIPTLPCLKLTFEMSLRPTISLHWRVRQWVKLTMSPMFCFFFLLFQSKHNRQSQRIKKKNMSNVWMWWIWLWNETLLEKMTTQNCPLWKTQNNLFQSQIFCFEVTKTI